MVAQIFYACSDYLRGECIRVVSRQVVYKRVILFDVDQAAASSILGSGSASLPTALGMVR